MKNLKLASDAKGLKYYEGSTRIDFGDYAVIFAHQEGKRIIGYAKRNNQILMNLNFQSITAYEDKLIELKQELTAEARQDFLSKVPHIFREGEIFVAHENIKNTENDSVHFYQITKINKSSNIVTVQEIEAQIIKLGNYNKAVPLVGRIKGVAIEDFNPDGPAPTVQSKHEFEAELTQGTFKSPNNLLAFPAKFTLLKIHNNITSKIYDPIAFGLKIGN